MLLFFLMLYGLSSALALLLAFGLAFLLLHLVVDAPSDGTAQHYDDEDDDPRLQVVSLHAAPHLQHVLGAAAAVAHQCCTVDDALVRVLDAVDGYTVGLLAEEVGEVDVFVQ